MKRGRARSTPFPPSINQTEEEEGSFCLPTPTSGILGTLEACSTPRPPYFCENSRYTLGWHMLCRNDALSTSKSCSASQKTPMLQVSAPMDPTTVIPQVA